MGAGVGAGAARRVQIGSVSKRIVFTTTTGYTDRASEKPRGLGDLPRQRRDGGAGERRQAENQRAAGLSEVRRSPAPRARNTSISRRRLTTVCRTAAMGARSREKAEARERARKTRPCGRRALRRTRDRKEIPTALSADLRGAAAAAPVPRAPPGRPRRPCGPWPASPSSAGRPRDVRDAGPRRPRDRTPRAGGAPGRADDLAEVHQRRGRVSRPAWREQALDLREDAASVGGRAGQAVQGEEA